MTSIAVKTAGPDRPRRTLQVLAYAGEAGLTTPQITDALGSETEGWAARQRALTWTGTNLRNAEARGWVTRIGMEKAARQMTIRWQITPAGVERLNEYETARTVPTTRQEAAEKRAKASDEKLKRQAVLAVARPVAESPTLSDEGRLELTRQLRDAGCTYQEIGDLFGKSREWIRLVVKHGTWKITAEMITSRKAADDLTRLGQEIDMAQPCIRCGKPAGEGYHIVNAQDVTCDDCWDERLR